MAKKVSMPCCCLCGLELWKPGAGKCPAGAGKAFGPVPQPSTPVPPASWTRAPRSREEAANLLLWWRKLKFWFLLLGQEVMRRRRLDSWDQGQAGLPYVPVLANLVP